MNDEKKIIVDEDWKSRIEAERQEEALQASEKEKQPAAQAAQFPPASFEMLLTTLATEAMVALGQLPHPATQKAEQNLGQARYVIDMLEVISEKTKGNLSPSEEAMQIELLHQLRMGFVAAEAAPSPPAGNDATKPDTATQ